MDLTSSRSSTCLNTAILPTFVKVEEVGEEAFESQGATKVSRAALAGCGADQTICKKEEFDEEDEEEDRHLKPDTTTNIQGRWTDHSQISSCCCPPDLGEELS